MITLSSSDSIQGVAGSATSVTSTISGDELTIATGVDTFKVLDQRQLPSSAASLYAPASGKSALIKQWLLANTTAGSITVTLYMNGTAAANQIASLPIPANGEAILADDGWHIHDANGSLITTTNMTLTGDVTGTGTGSVATTLATVNTNTGSFGTASNVGQFSVNGKGLTTAAANVPIVIAESAVTNLTTDLAAKVPTARLINTTAPITGGGDLSADRTIAISAATTTTPGSLSAANYNNINNFFGNNFYNVQDYGVSPANAAATNVSNMNTLLQTTANDKSRYYFPGSASAYQFNAGLTAITKDCAFEGERGFTTIAITADLGNATPFLNFFNTGFYSSLRDINFVNFHAQTTNMLLNFRNDANVEVLDCFFTGASNWVDVLTFSGTNSGNGAILKNVYVANWSGKAINVSSALDTMYIEDLEIVGTGVAGSVGIYCDNGGAMLMSNSQIINADINVELNPANGNTVSAVFGVNCFFDQGKTNCMLITGAGTGTNARHHFIGSWFTIAGTGSSSGAGANTKCIQITTAGTGIHAGIEFQNCWIMNATPGSTGTIEGILATSVQDITITGCQFAGWTNDIQVTPASAGTCAVMLTGNNFDNAGLITGSANNVILNAGSFTYRSVNVNANVFGGTTTKLTDNSATVAGNKNITGNSGLVQPNMASGAFATTRPTLTASALNLVGGTSIQLPTNGLRVGSRIRFTLSTEKTAAGIAAWTLKVKFGTANTTADGEILSWTSGTNTAAIDVAAYICVDVLITAVGSGTSATASGQIIYTHNLTAATGLGSLAPAPTLATGFNSTLASPWLHIDITPGASAVMTAVGNVEIIA